MEIISFYLIKFISFYPWLQIKWNQFPWFYNIFIYHFWSFINVCCWIFIWIKSIVLERSWKWFSSIRVSGCWFIFPSVYISRYINCWMHFTWLKFCWIPFSFKVCSRWVLMFPFVIKKFLFTLNFNNYLFCLFIFHISKFGKFWDVTIVKARSRHLLSA